MEEQSCQLLEELPSLSGFEVLEKLGSGGMGEVFLARQISLDRTVAVKMLHAVPGGTRSASLNQESRLMAALAHPHVVNIHDFGHANGRDYLVMEHVKGASLRERMQPNQPWSPAEAWPILDAVADALAYIHSRNILHLDLKPENVLLDEQGRAKITDFGLAVVDRQSQTLKVDGVSQGSIDYCPPEQRYGLPVDARSDLFSLAAMAYELLTGRLPARVYRSVSTHQRGLSQAVDRVLRRGLERSPEDRPGTVDEFRRELGLALAPPRPKRRVGLIAVLVFSVGLMSALAVHAMHGFDWLTKSSTAAVWNGQSWLIYEKPEELNGLGPLEGDLSAAVMQPVVVQGLRPDPASGPPIPAWPWPGPVLLLHSAEHMAFVHLHEDPSLAARFPRSWQALRSLPSLLPEDNYAVVGWPTEKRMVEEDGIWRATRRSEWTENCAAYFGSPPDRPDEPALCFVRTANATNGLDINAYQWLARVPSKEGSLLVVRYRSRAEEGNGRLSVSVHLPLHIPKADQSETANRLRKVANLHPSNVPTAEESVFEYSIDDWVQPGPEWREFYTVFPWPSFCKSGDFRNLVIKYTGTGKVWVERIEVFPWQLPSAQ